MSLWSNELLFTLVQVATLIAVYANWGFARIKGIGWGWAGVIWLYSIVFYIPLDWIKFAIRYILSGRAWDNLLQNKVFNSSEILLGLHFYVASCFLIDFIFVVLLQTAFTTKKDYGREEREAQWALAQRTLHGLQPPETSTLFSDKSSYRELSEIAEQAKRRAEVARYCWDNKLISAFIASSYSQIAKDEKEK